MKPSEWDSLFDEIDRVLSIKLTDKQKDYLKDEYVIFKRREGGTTAHIIKQILTKEVITDETLIYEGDCDTLYRQNYYKRMFIEVLEKLLTSAKLRKHIGHINLNVSRKMSVEI